MYIDCSVRDPTSSSQRFDTKPEITVPPTSSTLKLELPPEMTSSTPLRRSTSGRMAPPSPLIRHSTSASTTVFADVHRDAAELPPPRTTSGLSLRPRDLHRPEVVASRQLPQRQRLAAPEDRRCRALRHPVSEFAAMEHDQRRWASLEHGVIDAHRSATTERPTRRVHSYEDRYLLLRTKPEAVVLSPYIHSFYHSTSDRSQTGTGFRNDICFSDRKGCSQRCLWWCHTSDVDCLTPTIHCVLPSSLRLTMTMTLAPESTSDHEHQSAQPDSKIASHHTIKTHRVLNRWRIWQG